MKNISILGSTGSVGTQTLEVVSQFPSRFRIRGLAAGRNIGLLKEQILRFKPDVVSVSNGELASLLSDDLPLRTCDILYGNDGAASVASESGADLVVSAMVGAVGLKPTLSAIRAGINVALANKEVLVMAGAIVREEAERFGVGIIPIDSEHSALFQALGCGSKESVKRIILTASGGPFFDTPSDKLEDVTVEVALDHPTWSMGNKITIDSATLMNKGLEVIEAKWLFDFPPDKISVCIHPESIVHSMVEYIDGSIIAQMSVPDMRIPIAYSLAYPKRIPLDIKGNDPIAFRELTFKDADTEKFPALRLAFDAIHKGGTMPAVMSGANEVAVGAFLDQKLGYLEIVELVERVMELNTNHSAGTIEEILESDRWARKTAESIINGK